MEIVFVFVVIALLLFLVFRKKKQAIWKKAPKSFPNEWKTILHRKVNFYQALNQAEKKQFEQRIHEFLLNCKVTGVDVDIDDEDRILVAASAIIPVFRFPNWKYSNIDEVLIYPSSFNEKFETSGEDRNILGMVGTGYMEGKMILSKKALREGFANASDKKNTAIHEFVHLIDKSDGVIDGVPSALLEQQYTIPWLEMIRKKIEEIYEGESDINPYGATNKAEFFSVASEYFFERPKLLKTKHPKLYELLQEVFETDMSEMNLRQTKREIGRNEPCVCGSGKKYKKCCGR